jgi:hypothetical protein
MSRRTTTKRRTPAKQTWDPKFDDVLETMANGKALGFQKACRMHHVDPSRLYAEMRVQPELEEKYAQAKAHSLKAMADEMTCIADDSTKDVQRDRLRIDTRKWLLSKLAPRVYGDRVQTEVSGQLRVVKVDDSEEGLL